MTVDGKKLTSMLYLKWLDLKDAVKQKGREVATFVADHPESVVAAIAGVKILHGVAQTANRNRAINEDRRHRNRDVWDPRSGVYFTTKRNLTNRDKSSISEGLKNGRTTAEILRELNLI